MEIGRLSTVYRFSLLHLYISHIDTHILTHYQNQITLFAFDSFSLAHCLSPISLCPLYNKNPIGAPYRSPLASALKVRPSGHCIVVLRPRAHDGRPAGVLLLSSGFTALLKQTSSRLFSATWIHATFYIQPFSALRHTQQDRQLTLQLARWIVFTMNWAEYMRSSCLTLLALPPQRGLLRPRKASPVVDSASPSPAKVGRNRGGKILPAASLVPS
jgi:hypothetical protein